MRKLVVTPFLALVALTAIAMEVGKPAPALTIQRVGNPAVQVNQYKGKVVALAFMLTTCPHCQNLTRVLSAINKEYEGKGVQILGCAFNDDAAALLPQFIQTTGANFPVGYCTRDVVLNYLQYSILKSLYVPHMVFLDKKGVVQGDYLGESEFMQNPDKNIRAELDKLIKGAPTTSAANHKE
jgi:thiol-disulfide isomerase/thioredoxin